MYMYKYIWRSLILYGNIYSAKAMAGNMYVLSARAGSENVTQHCWDGQKQLYICTYNYTVTPC